MKLSYREDATTETAAQDVTQAYVARFALTGGCSLWASRPFSAPASVSTSAAGDLIMYDVACTRVHAEAITVTPPDADGPYVRFMTEVWFPRAQKFGTKHPEFGAALARRWRLVDMEPSER